MNNFSIKRGKLGHTLVDSFFFISIILSLFAVQQYVPKASLIMRWISLPLILLYISSILKKSRIYGISYYIVLLAGTILHIGLLPLNDVINDFYAWVSLVMLLVLSANLDMKSLLPIRILLIIFVLECLVALFERLTETLIFPAMEIIEHTNEYADDKTFRSYSLMGHPLTNANVTSIIMAFVLCTKKMNNYLKWMLLLLGTIALWAFNSRAAMLYWMAVFTYKLFFAKLKISYFVVGGLLMAFVIIPLGEYLYEAGYFGRLEFDFSDSSTETRFDALLYFMMYPWGTTDIINGGRLLYMPGSDLLIENGILVTLGYWGIIIGSLKVVLEFIISYKFLVNYKFSDKLIIFMALWLVGLGNNNTFTVYPLLFFMYCNMAFNLYKPEVLRNLRVDRRRDRLSSCSSK